MCTLVRKAGSEHANLLGKNMGSQKVVILEDELINRKHASLEDHPHGKGLMLIKEIDHSKFRTINFMLVVL